MAFATGKKGYLTAKLNPADTSLTIDRDIGVSAGRLKLKDPNNRDTTYVEWLSFASNTAVGDGTYTLGTLVRGLSQTADPATAGTGKTFGAGTECVLVAMHDQIPDKSGNVIFAGDITADDILANSLGFASTTKAGITVNNLTTTQRDALATVANGMIIYNTTAGEFQIRQSGSWVTMSSGSTQPNASTTVAGKVEIATQSEFDAGTDIGGTGAPLVALPSQIANIGLDTQYYAGEALIQGDSVYSESYSTFANATVSLNISDVSANTRIFFPIMGSGSAMTTFSLALKKVGTPTQNLNFRIETDNGSGLPTGTLFNANGTATIAQSSLTTSFADTALTLAGSITIPAGQTCHIVMFQGIYGSETINNSNYYQVGISTNNTSTRIPGRYTGSAYVATGVNETPTWTGDTAGGSATSVDNNMTALKSFQITALTKTTGYAWTTCTIFQGGVSQTATFSGDIATFGTPITIFPGSFTIRLSAGSSIAIRIRSSQTVTTPLFSTLGNIQGVADLTAREIFHIPYVYSTGIFSTVIAETSARVSYKIGSYPSFSAKAYSKGSLVSRYITGTAPVTVVDNTLYYISDTAGAIGTSAGINSAKAGRGFGTKLFIDKNA